MLRRMPSRFRIETLAEVDSTQLEARRRLEAGDAAAHQVLVADVQSAGRGRRGHRWYASAGSSLMFTALLPPPPLERPARLLLLVAVAAARALDDCGCPGVAIKWPNDLYLGERKLGGLIAERARGPRGVALLLGMGLNLAAPEPPLPDAVAARATHAGLPHGRVTRDRVLHAVLAHLDTLLDALGTPAEAAWREAFRRRSWLDGRRAEIHQAGRRFAARIESVSADGDLLLDDGRRLLGEHVETVVALENRGPR